MTTTTITKTAAATKPSGRTLPNMPGVEQNILLKAKLRKLEIGDSIQFRPASGGPGRLVKVHQILENKKDINAPRLFIASSRFTAENVRILENQVMHVIPQSKDEYEDLILQEDKAI